MSRHRADVRPRWGRIGFLGASALVTVIAVLAGFGVIAGSGDGQTLAHDPSDAAAAVAHVTTGSPSSSASASPSASATPSASASASPSASASQSSPTAESTALPADSGSGRRAVFSQSEQRVWIVGDDDEVERTYLASGSIEDNLRPGTYHVYGKSRWATGIEDSGVMQYFVRFAHGTDSGASIGFHSIPTKHGEPLQTIAQLGTPLSHGCIRQKTEDAIAMWDFADIGTEVVVLA